MKRSIAIFVFFSITAFAQAPDLGVMLANIGGSPQRRIEIAKQLGAGWYRPEAALLGQADPKCDDCEAAKAAGLKLVLVVRNSSDAKKPSAPVSDAEAFQQKLRAALDHYRPEIVVVENEPEDQKNSFAGTPEEYGTELKMACETAHSVNVKCTDGGLASGDMGALVLDELWKTDQLQSGDFGIKTEIVRAKGPGGVQFMGKNVGGDQKIQEAIQKATGAFLDKHRPEIDRSRAFLSAAASANVDYANFHWHELRPEEVTTVLDVLGRISKHPQMSDGIGQTEDRAFETTEKLRLLRRAGVNPVIWVAAGTKDVVGLVDKNGALGTNGRAFQAEAQKKQ